MQFAYKKSLGQNFIYDQEFLRGIVRGLDLQPTDTIIEVGTGAGTLTRVLAPLVKKVITYEIDTRLQDTLQKQFAGVKNIELHFCDAMKVTDFSPDFKLVANIPYYITTPLILKFLATPQCRELCVLVQDDVAHRIVAAPGGKEYGALSVTLQAQAHCRIITHVPRTLFKPQPNVDSAFVQIMKNGVTPPTQFDNLVKNMFSARRKTVLNAVKQALGLDSDTARKLLADCALPEHIRPENIPPDKYIELSRLLAR